MNPPLLEDVSHVVIYIDKNQKINYEVLEYAEIAVIRATPFQDEFETMTTMTYMTYII